MIKCSKCGNEVKKGKYCTKCGTLLVIQDNMEDNLMTKVSVCPNCGANVNGKFCSTCGASLVANTQGTIVHQNSNSTSNDFFKELTIGIQNKLGNLATGLNAIKSDFGNNRIIYWVEKMPSVKEKKFIISNCETAFINSGQGYKRIYQDCVIDNDEIECCYIKNDTSICLDSFVFSIPANICKVSGDDKIELNVMLSLKTTVIDIEKFVLALLGIKKESWTKVSFGNYVNKNVADAVRDCILEDINSTNGIIINKACEQIKKSLTQITSIINNELLKFSVKLENCEIIDVTFDYDKANEIMIKDLYK